MGYTLEKFAADCRALRNQGRAGNNWLAHQKLAHVHLRTALRMSCRRISASA